MNPGEIEVTFSRAEAEELYESLARTACQGIVRELVSLLWNVLNNQPAGEVTPKNNPSHSCQNNERTINP